MRISSSVALCATIILQAICGYTVAETTGEEPGGNLRAGGAGGAGTGGMGGMRIGGDGRNAISATTFLQQAYRIQELQVEFHSRYSLIRFNLADMQRMSIAWCPVTVVPPDGGWHACLIYKDCPQYIERDQLMIYNATWRQDDVRNGPVTFPLQVVTDSGNMQSKAVGDVTVQCRNKRCSATPEQEQQNILHWEGRAKPAL